MIPGGCGVLERTLAASHFVLPPSSNYSPVVNATPGGRNPTSGGNGGGGPGQNPSRGYSSTQKDLCQVSTSVATNHDHFFLSSRLVTLIVGDLFLAKLDPWGKAQVY